MCSRPMAIATVWMVAVSVCLLDAQAKPDFSGKWVMDPPARPAATGDRGGGRGGFQPGFGSEFTVKHDAAAVTITRAGQATPLVYKLDGSESKNMVTRDGQPQEQVAKATWDGNKLVI